MLRVYGLYNCDTCRKATKWLTAKNIPHTFHDVRKDGVDRAMVEKWVKDVGWVYLLNRRGTTWRGLSDADKDCVDEAKAIDLMTQYPVLIKRPVCNQNGTILVGFKETDKATFIL
jgi:Spx/MgsR family transcriptional regulator